MNITITYQNSFYLFIYLLYYTVIMIITPGIQSDITKKYCSPSWTFDLLRKIMTGALEFKLI